MEEATLPAEAPVIDQSSFPAPAERAAFVLRHYEGAPVEEIARALGKPAGATRHCVFRAVQKLREALAPRLDDARRRPGG